MGRALFAGFVLAVVLLIGYRAYEGISNPALAGVITGETPAVQTADFRGWD
ncbi:MAG TPA: hypothetical protein VD973_25590 [Symbiobacteriaceae bacterium]|nr:hypothetical protein [Symbiobacteriaceae bacterium]